MKSKYIEQGYISGAHGVHGEVKMRVWSGSMDGFRKIKTLYADSEGKRGFAVKSVRGSLSSAAVKLEGVDTPEEAAKLRGLTLYVDRDELDIPADRILVCDIVGLPVVDAQSGKVYGTVGSIEEYPASDIYMVETENGTVQVPDVPQFIKKITDDAVFITPLDGMFE